MVTFLIKIFGNTALGFRSSPFLVLFILLLTSTRVNAQFNFPSTQVIRDNHVKSIKVYRRPLYYTGGDIDKRKDLHADSTKRGLLSVYYFNEYGYPDSIIQNPTETGFFKKYVYTYDGQDNIGYKIISSDGSVTQHGTITKTANNELISRSWEYGKLRSKVTINSDSIITEELGFYPGDTVWRSANRFDPKTDTRTEYSKGLDDAYVIETYQWFTEDGMPKSFKHSLVQKIHGQDSLVRKEKIYDLDSAGNVVNKYLGRFDDPYLQYNYFKRYRKFTSARFYSQSWFKEDHLVESKEVSELYSFSGIKLVVRYELEYEFRK